MALATPSQPSRTKRKTSWNEVVDLQDELIRFVGSEFGLRYLNTWGKGLVGDAANRYAVEHRDWQRPSNMLWAEHLGEIELAKLRAADPMFVSSDVQALIRHAVEDFKTEQLLVEDIFPTYYGFCVFPEPFSVVDGKGKTIAFRAIAWEPIPRDSKIEGYMLSRRIHPDEMGGMFISAWAHRDDEDDYPLGELMSERGLTNPIMTLSYLTPWSFAADGTPRDLNDAGLDTFIKICQVLWRLSKQQLLSAGRELLPRAERKRARRADLDEEISVIRLRRTKQKRDKDAVPRDVNWTCRWIVDSHWRNQWYPSLQAHRQIYILPYPKGPEHLPLRIPDRIYALTR